MLLCLLWAQGFEWKWCYALVPDAECITARLRQCMSVSLVHMPTVKKSPIT